MSSGPQQNFLTGIASGASTSSSLDMGGKSFTQIGVYPVTMSTNALISVYGSTDNATFYPIRLQSRATATVQFNALQIPTATSGSWAVFDTPPFRYLQFVTSAVVSGGVSFIVCAFD